MQNFKQFKDITLDFTKCKDYQFSQDALTEDKKTIKTALVFGRNAAGKTSLGIGIMDIVCHLTNKYINNDKYDIYLNADSDKKFATFTYKFLLGKDTLTYKYNTTGFKELSKEEVFCNDELIVSFSKKSKKPETPGTKKFGFSTLQWDSFIKNPFSIVRFIVMNSALPDDNPLRKLVDFAENMLWFRRTDRGNDFLGFLNNTDNIHEFIIKNGLDNFKKFLKDFGIEEEVVSSRDNQGKQSLYFKHKNRLLPIVLVGSSGTQTLILFYYWLNFLNQTSFFIIDEFDAFYHYSLSEKIYRFIKKNCKSQCVLTTHNTNLMQNKHARPDACFIITPQQLSPLFALTERELREGHNIEKLYIANEFSIQ